VLVVLACSAPLIAQEQYLYRVFVDADVNSASGCGYEMGTVGVPNYLTGFEFYLELRTFAPGEVDEYQTSGVIVNCDGTEWDLGSISPIAGNSWLAELGYAPVYADVIQGFIPLTELNFSTRMRLVLHAENTLTGQVDTLQEYEGEPVIFMLEGENIPVLSNMAIGILFLLLAYVVITNKSGRVMICSMAITLTGSFYISKVDGSANDHCAAWGWCFDWLNQLPFAIDAAGDTVDPAVDIRGLYIATADNGDIAIRIDISDISTTETLISGGNPGAPAELILNHPHTISSNTFFNYFYYAAVQGEKLLVHAELDVHLTDQEKSRCASSPSSYDTQILVYDSNNTLVQLECGENMEFVAPETGTYIFHFNYPSNAPGVAYASSVLGDSATTSPSGVQGSPSSPRKINTLIDNYISSNTHFNYFQYSGQAGERLIVHAQLNYPLSDQQKSRCSSNPSSYDTQIIVYSSDFELLHLACAEDIDFILASSGTYIVYFNYPSNAPGIVNAVSVLGDSAITSPYGADGSPGSPKQIDTTAGNITTSNTFYNYYQYTAQAGDRLVIQVELDNPLSTQQKSRCASNPATAERPSSYDTQIHVYDSSFERAGGVCGEDLEFIFPQVGTYIFHFSYASQSAGVFYAAHLD